MQIVLHVRTHDKSCGLYDTYKHVRYIALHIQISRGPNEYGTHVAFVHRTCTHTHTLPLSLSLSDSLSYTHTHTLAHTIYLSFTNSLSQSLSALPYRSHTHNFSLAYKIFLLCQLSLPTKSNTSSPGFVISTGWRRLIGSPKLQIIFHTRATKYRSLLRKMTHKDKGSYESSPPCSRSLYLCVSKRVLQVTVKKRPTNNKIFCKRDMNNHLCTGIFACALCKRAYILELKEAYK